MSLFSAMLQPSLVNFNVCTVLVLEIHEQINQILKTAAIMLSPYKDVNWNPNISSNNFTSQRTCVSNSISLMLTQPKISYSLRQYNKIVKDH